MQVTSHQFKQQARVALKDGKLQQALAKAKGGFVDKRRMAVEALPEFEAIRDLGRDIKEHTLSHLDFYLTRYEGEVEKNGGRVHWARTPREAREIITEICRSSGAKRVIKGKSMVGEEIGINPALESQGLEVVETDLGEYIIQLADEPPSHIIAPAVHKTREAVTELFQRHHRKINHPDRPQEIEEIVQEARQVLREAFLNAEVGITGANFLIAETGQHVLVTNEGNGDLCSSLPKVQIIITSIEKVVPTLDDATTLLRLLGRSATGQEMSCYTTFYSGPKRDDDPNGPTEYHVVLLDNGRSTMLQGSHRNILRCIRCGACLNHCPVYGAIGGHAYGWVYPGPMGSVLSPLLVGLEKTSDLANACTLNGRCQQVCPMRINLPDMLREHRVEAVNQGRTPLVASGMLKIWGYLALRPNFYRIVMNLMVRSLSAWRGGKGYIAGLWGAGSWFKDRDLPVPQGRTFMSQWRDREKY